jgi:SAM-dependent methyltransferase
MNENAEEEWNRAQDAKEFEFMRDNPPPVLDACCGSRMMWFDKQDERALFIDKRRERIEMRPDKSYPSGCVIDVNPDMQLDFTCLPFSNSAFSLVVFDPPHLQREEAKGCLTYKYGVLNGDWRSMLRDGFAECFRVLRPEGVLIFKWAETEVPLREILALTDEKPLFGHKSGKQMGTHWVTFIKVPKVGADKTANAKVTGSPDLSASPSGLPGYAVEDK